MKVWVLPQLIGVSLSAYACLSAATPVDATGEPVTVSTSGGQSDDWTNRRYQAADLWALRPLQPQLPPRTAPHPVDAFLLLRQPSGLSPAPHADRRTLIRRLSFDLNGLPPTPESIDRFLSDRRSDAYQRLVDRLLASPRYGEQWGRHWLDVVRYADSSGFANDFLRPNAWRYRDYVIRSFNSDKPYDQF
ncbi:MAG: DUF1549 domain-containing protein, partial [Planctomycetaceae bacterium]